METLAVALINHLESKKKHLLKMVDEVDSTLVKEIPIIKLKIEEHNATDSVEEKIKIRREIREIVDYLYPQSYLDYHFTKHANELYEYDFVEEDEE